MANTQIGRQIAEINNLIHRKIQKHSFCDAPQCDEKSGLSHSSACIIAYLYDHNDVDTFQRDLEKEFNVRRSTMSKILTLLEQKDYIKREEVCTDRRLKKIVLTQKATLIADEIKHQRNTLEEIMAGSITKEELTAFYRTCEKIKQNLSQEDQT
ncbi:MAG: MarR family transcriptional regulator [Ruminococcus sp.]|nr:MarR family transcriptional regulator [Ruminococcus sp.]